MAKPGTAALIGCVSSIVVLSCS